jgi:hypothetical protein
MEAAHIVEGKSAGEPKSSSRTTVVLKKLLVVMHTSDSQHQKFYEKAGIAM